jgi:aryl-alcohol dehydrogenase-like predicted oxidoreductase
MAWEVVGRLGADPARAIVKRALDGGVNFIDTANVYSEGESERLLGAALKELGVHREEVVIATKVRGRMGTGPNQLGLGRSHILHEVEASLRRLGTDYIDLYQIHGVDKLTPLDETMRALEDVVRKGYVRYLGCSNLMAWQIMKANGIAERNAWTRFESVQAYYSIAGRDIEREIVPLMNEEKLSLLSWSPLAGGLLSGKFSADAQGPEGARRSSFDFPPVDRPRAFRLVDEMRTIAEAHGRSVAQVALAWILHQPHSTSVIIGAKSPEQLDDNLAATTLRLAPEELAKLEESSRLPPEYPGWMVAMQNRDR